MKRTASIFFSLLIPMTCIAACEHSKDPALRSPSYASSSASATSTAVTLDGTWTYPDSYDAGDNGITGDSDDNWSTESLIFSGNGVTYRQIIYLTTSAGAKGDAYMQFDSAFTFTTGTAGSADGSTKIDLVLTDITATPKSAAAVLILNAASYAGYTDWQADTAKSVAGINIDGSAYDTAGTKSYDIYKISGSSLYLGDTGGTNDGSTDALRPISFETISATKQ